MITFLDYYKKLPQNLVAEYIGSREIQFFCLGGIEEIDKIEEIEEMEGIEEIGGDRGDRGDSPLRS